MRIGSYYLSDGQELVVIVGSVAMSVFSVIGAFGAVFSRAQFPLTLARIEQLRSDAAAVDPAQAEDVIGQVTDANKKIAAAQTCNRLWYCDFVEPDAWNDALIPVPKLSR